MKKIVWLLLSSVLLFSLCACSKNEQSAMYLKPTQFSEETMQVLDLLGDEIQFYDISLDDSVKSFAILLWVYRNGEWLEEGKVYGENDLLSKQIAIRLTDSNYEIYYIDDDGHEKVSYTAPDSLFEESIGIGGTRINQKTPIELNQEIPIWVKIGTSSNRMEVSASTEDFRKAECNAGIAVTLTVSDEMIE